MTSVGADDWLRTLAEDRADIDRSSTAEKVADKLRASVLGGEIQPGQQLNEKALGDALRVSRNTLREAFRLLTHERLLVHEYSKGVFVRKPDWRDIADLYAARRVIECGAVRAYPQAPEQAKRAIRTAVDDAVEASTRGDWTAVGTHNIKFHQALTALAGSARLDEEVERLLAELRLAFHVMGDPKRFHADYLPLNLEITAHLEAGAIEPAVDALSTYFETAEHQLVTALRGE
ncbi:GntR family transcriptional regulator [Saccharothrix variisporea]|uniref:GntR family transcriptional regulator n=1 Tax=Saccharothrix variisporea TaxID=543527 RepID=A0A495XDC9_9PSEU|nr:GntR family transcriptional regulator [Saccharothrix variisporea]RKT71659.1 GntR family transcriptional regulator [Saccharothrix variisporea]